MLLETLSACPICSGKKFTNRFQAKDFTTTGEMFHVQHCDTCGLLLTNPRPHTNELGKYYQSSNYISHTGGTNSLFDKIYREARKRALIRKLDLVNSYQSKFNLLDYGCGTGQFLETCKDAGWTVTGVEPSLEARSLIRKDISVRPTLTEITEQSNAITLWHVLEHVPDLNETLAKLRSLLTNNGTIFIAVPNHESQDAKHYKEYWAAYDVPRHLWHFNKKNIKELLTKHNLKLVDIQPMKLDAYYVSLLSEQYIRPTQNIFLQYARGVKNGFISNLKAGRDNYSSLIYIAGT